MPVVVRRLASLPIGLLVLLGMSVAAWSQASTATAAAPPAALQAQMRRIIDVYTLIAGTAITGLTPQDARQQFSAEDAAKLAGRVDGAGSCLTLRPGCRTP